MARRQAQERGPRTSVGGALFLGAVVARPTGDEEAPMAAEFSLLVARVNQLLNRYHAADIGGLQLAEALVNERVVDVAGGEWTIGATSGAWYRRMPGMDWAQVPPPGPSTKARVQLIVNEEGAVHDVSAPGDVFAALYDTPPSAAVGTERKWLGDDASGDAGWVADAPSVEGVVEIRDVDGFDPLPPPAPPTPVGTHDPIADPFEALASSVPPDPFVDLHGTAPTPDQDPVDTEALLARWLDPNN